MQAFSVVLRIGAGLVLLFWGLIELLRAAALALDPGAYALIAHSALGAVAIWAAVELWLKRAGARVPILLLGVGLAAFRLVEAFVMGTRAWFPAVLSAAALLAGALLFAAWEAQGARRTPAWRVGSTKL